MDIVKFAWQIIAMEHEIKSLNNELNRLKDIEIKYNKLLDSSIAHNNKMIGNMVDVFLTPGVTDAFIEGKKEKK